MKYNKLTSRIIDKSLGVNLLNSGKANRLVPNRLVPIDILKMKTLFQEIIKKIKTITVPIRKKSHPKYHQKIYTQ